MNSSDADLLLFQQKQDVQDFQTQKYNATQVFCMNRDDDAVLLFHPQTNKPLLGPSVSLKNMLSDIFANESVTDSMRKNYLLACRALSTTETGGSDHQFADNAIELHKQVRWYTGKEVHKLGFWGDDGVDFKQQGLLRFKEYKKVMETFLHEDRFELIPLSAQISRLLAKLADFKVGTGEEEMNLGVKEPFTCVAASVENGRDYAKLPTSYTESLTHSYAGLSVDFKEYFINVLSLIGKEDFTIGMIEDKFTMELLYSIFTNFNHEDNSLVFFIANKMYEHLLQYRVDGITPSTSLYSGFLQVFLPICKFGGKRFSEFNWNANRQIGANSSPVVLLNNGIVPALINSDFYRKPLYKIYSSEPAEEKSSMSAVKLSRDDLVSVFGECHFSMEPSYLRTGLPQAQGSSSEEEDENDSDDSEESDETIDSDEEDEVEPNGKRTKTRGSEKKSSLGKKLKTGEGMDVFIYNGLKFIVPTHLSELFNELDMEKETDKFHFMAQLKESHLKEFKKNVESMVDGAIDVDDCISHIGLVPMGEERRSTRSVHDVNSSQKSNQDKDMQKIRSITPSAVYFANTIEAIAQTGEFGEKAVAALFADWETWKKELSVTLQIPIMSIFEMLQLTLDGSLMVNQVHSVVLEDLACQENNSGTISSSSSSTSSHQGGWVYNGAAASEEEPSKASQADLSDRTRSKLGLLAVVGLEGAKGLVSKSTPSVNVRNLTDNVSCLKGNLAYIIETSFISIKSHG
jgi:hypothetical protein